MTYIYRELTAADIARELLADEYANWNHAQATALAEHLIEYAEDSGQPLELDRVAIRCDYAAYNSAIEAAADYGENIKDEEEARCYIESRTVSIMAADGSVIIVQI